MTEITIGGQAVVEGVLMRTKTEYAIAVRNPKKKIIVKKHKISTGSNRLFKLPLLRGVLAMYETLVIGFKALIYSAQISAGEKEKLSKKEMAIAIVISIALAIGIFIALPFFFASRVTDDNLLFNLLDGALRLLALFSYLIVISFFKDVKRMFQYHGAEHMTIHAHEHGKKLTPKNIMAYPTMHPRCGTSFLLIVVIISVFVFSVVTAESLIIKFLSRLVLLPVIAGVSYEFLKLTAKYQSNPLIKPFTMPGIWLQYITTKRPNNKQIEVAVASLKALKN